MGNKANAGHIIIKGTSKGEHAKPTPPYGMAKFYTDTDRESTKPAFCYGQRKRFLQEEVDGMRRQIEMGLVDPAKRIAVEYEMRQKEQRLAEINESCDNARAVIEADPEGWLKKHRELGEEIAGRMPSRKDVRERRVNPRTVLKNEKAGGLEQKKRAYQVLGRALKEANIEAESNVAFLERDK